MEICPNCLKIGKGMDVGIRLNDDFASKLCAVIHCEEERFFISGPGGDPGIYLGEKRIRREKIADETLFNASDIECLEKTLEL